MNKDKKIELQNKVIHDLRAENESLSTRVKELEGIVSDNEEIIATCKKYKDEHEKFIEEITIAKERYTKAFKDLMAYKSKYQKEMDSLLKTVKKNI